jgi:hypothetical protein
VNPKDLLFPVTVQAIALEVPHPNYESLLEPCALTDQVFAAMDNATGRQ